MTPTELHASFNGPPATLAGTDSDQLALELGKAAVDGQQQAPVRRGGIRPCVCQRLERGALLGDGVERVEQVPRGPGEPVRSPLASAVCDPSHNRLADFLRSCKNCIYFKKGEP